MGHHQRHRWPDSRAQHAWKKSRSSKQTGTLEPGRYILLRYLDPPWQGFYDIFKVINDDLLIGRVYLGDYPNGMRAVHLPHDARLRLRTNDRGRPRALFTPRAPFHAAADLDGVWRMDVISNANHAAAASPTCGSTQARRASGEPLPVHGAGGRPGDAQLSGRTISSLTISLHSTMKSARWTRTSWSAST